MTTKKDTKGTAAKGKSSKGFDAEEKAAMKERAKELKASKNKEDGEKDALSKIAEMPEADRVMAERIHAIIKDNAPDLLAKTWYGQPAYANKEGKIICFFQSSAKFNTRYATLGFNEDAKLDDGSMWATAFALKKLTADDEKKIAALVKKATS
jgi:uncharacterized protein YdhG (YjbR/CyaY superfamily)